jgi:beta-lactamase class D
MNKLPSLIIPIAFMLLATNMVANAITTREYSQLFKNYQGCFILYHVNENKIISEYSPNNRCNERISPDSTFKIALSLMAFDQGIINQKTVFKWDGQVRDLPDWNQDQTPQSWLKNSVVWVSQHITPQLGYARIQHYLAAFSYGNQDLSGDPGQNNGLTHAWLSSSLKISAIEQLNFLKAMLRNELPVSNAAIANTKQNMYLGRLDNGADYYGKTGAGRHGHNERQTRPSLLRDGWFVGFIEDNAQQYIFISNLTDKAPAPVDKLSGNANIPGSILLKPITMKILNAYFAK